MKKNKKPVHAKGYRNIFCPYYRKCLDHASKRHWEYWTCLHCSYKYVQESIENEPVSPANTDPYYSISPTIGEKFKNITI